MIAHALLWLLATAAAGLVLWIGISATGRCL